MSSRSIGFGIAALLTSMSTAHADLAISNDATSNVTCSDGVCSATAVNAVLNISELANMLASEDVQVVSGSLAQDIDFDASLSWTSNRTLTLDAFHSIFFRKPVVVESAGGLTIVTNDGGTQGDFQFLGRAHMQFRDLNAALEINGNSYKLLQSIKKFAHYGRRGGFIALANSYDAAKDGTFKQPLFPAGHDEASLEGLGNTIKNLSISADGDVGLFDGIGGLQFIRDLELENIDFEGSRSIGAFAGGSNGTIQNCRVT